MRRRSSGAFRERDDFNFLGSMGHRAEGFQTRFFKDNPGRAGAEGLHTGVCCEKCECSKNHSHILPALSYILRYLGHEIRQGLFIINRDLPAAHGRDFFCYKIQFGIFSNLRFVAAITGMCKQISCLECFHIFLILKGDFTQASSELFRFGFLTGSDNKFNSIPLILFLPVKNEIYL
jgi:hypothetical protein